MVLPSLHGIAASSAGGDLVLFENNTFNVAMDTHFFRINSTYQNVQFQNDTNNGYYRIGIYDAYEFGVASAYISMDLSPQRVDDFSQLKVDWAPHNAFGTVPDGYRARFDHQPGYSGNDSLGTEFGEEDYGVLSTGRRIDTFNCPSVESDQGVMVGLFSEYATDNTQNINMYIYKVWMVP